MDQVIDTLVLDPSHCRYNGVRETWVQSSVRTRTSEILYAKLISNLPQASENVARKPVQAFCIRPWARRELWPKFFDPVRDNDLSGLNSI